MGGIVAIYGSIAEGDGRRKLAAMQALCPYRGGVEVFEEPGIVLAVQRTGDDAALAASGGWVVAVHGFVSDWGSLVTGSAASDKAWDAAAGILPLLDRYPLARILTELSGHFALAVYARAKRELAVAADLGGTRPLYHSGAGLPVVVAPEPRQVLLGLGIPGRLDEAVVAESLAFHVNLLSPSRSLYAEVWRVPAADTCHWGADGSATCDSYWTPSFDAITGATPGELREETLDALLSAAGRTIPDDAPYALALSGGVDSSALWGAAGVLEASGRKPPGRRTGISMTAPGLACDETALVRANLACRPAPWIDVDISGCRTSQDIEWSASRLEMPPPGMMIGYPAYYAAMHRAGLGVEINGHGGDDLFHRDMHFLPYLLWRGRVGEWQRCRRHAEPGRSRSARVKDLLRHCLPRTAVPTGLLARRRYLASLHHPKWRGLFAAAEADRRRTWERAPPFFRSASEAWRRIRAGSYVCGADRLAAEHGVENRYPYLDGRFLRHALQLPDLIACEGAQYKAFQRGALQDLLPVAVREGPVVTYESLHALDRGWRDDPLPLERWVLFERGILDPARFGVAFSGREVELDVAMSSHYLLWEYMLRHLPS